MIKKFHSLIEESFLALKKEGFAMQAAIVTLKDGVRFKYKIQELPPKKTKKVKK